MPSKHLTTLSAALALSLALSPLLAQVRAVTPSPQDTAAISSIVTDLTNAWNQGDATAFSSHYAADGSFTNIIGTTLYGRPAFQKQHNGIFTTIYKGSTNAFTIDHLQFIRPDVAIADITSRLSGTSSFPPGVKPRPDGSILTRLQLVLTRESGTWWIVAFHNVVAVDLPPGA